MNRIKSIKLALALATAGLTALAGPAVANAATASVSNGVLTYTGASTEANHVTVSFDWGYGVYVVQDTGATSLTVSGSGCTKYSAQVVHCTYGSLASIAIHLGNGGSYAQSQLFLTPVTMYAGTGNDTLIGGGGGDTLIGGAGTDTLTAGTGNTHLIAGSGNTTMNGGPATDTFQGGAGQDTINSRDTKAESVSCGGGVDTVVADSSDTLAADCETADNSQPPAPTGDSTQPTGGDTSGGGSSDPSGGGDATTPGGGAPIEAPPILVAPKPATVTSSNNVPITIACPTTVTGDCEGTIALYIEDAGQPGHKLVAARRETRRVLVGKSRRFKVAGGHSAVVPVHLSRRGARIFRVRGHGKSRGHGKAALKLTAVVTLRTAAGTRSVTSSVTVKAARRQPPRPAARGRKPSARKR